MYQKNLVVLYMSKKPNRNNFPPGPNGNNAYQKAIKKGKWSETNNKRRVLEILLHNPVVPGNTLARLSVLNKSTHKFTKNPNLQKKIKNAYANKLIREHNIALKNYLNSWRYTSDSNNDAATFATARAMKKVENIQQKLGKLFLNSLPKYSHFYQYGMIPVREWKGIIGNYARKK
jgi:hypothetical protein